MKFTSFASGSTGNLNTIEDDRTSLIIEAGLPFPEIRRFLPKAPDQYEACLISHAHQDHCKGAGEMLRRGMSVIFGRNIDIPMRYGSMDVESFQVKHDDDTPNFGFMIKSRRDGETCVFMIDCSYSPARFKFSPTIFCIEANHDRDLMTSGESLNDRLYKSHMWIETTIDTLRANDLSRTREIHLLHISESRGDPEGFVSKVEAATGIPTYAAPAYRRAGSRELHPPQTVAGRFPASNPSI